MIKIMKTPAPKLSIFQEASYSGCSKSNKYTLLVNPLSQSDP
jgi:hypothetical protein